MKAPLEELEFYAEGNGFADVIMPEADGLERRFARGATIPDEYVERLGSRRLAMAARGMIGLRLREEHAA